MHIYDPSMGLAPKTLAHWFLAPQCAYDQNKICPENFYVAIETKTCPDRLSKVFCRKHDKSRCDREHHTFGSNRGLEREVSTSGPPPPLVRITIYVAQNVLCQKQHTMSVHAISLQFLKIAYKVLVVPQKDEKWSWIWGKPCPPKKQKTLYFSNAHVSSKFRIQSPWELYRNKSLGEHKLNCTKSDWCSQRTDSGWDRISLHHRTFPPQPNRECISFTSSVGHSSITFFCQLQTLSWWLGLENFKGEYFIF